MRSVERQVGPVTVIDIFGSITAHDYLALRQAITRALQNGQKRIVLNVAELEYVDSAALGELVACQLRASRGGMPIKLANAGGRLKKLLELTRLITVFETHDSVPAAIESFIEH